MKKKYYFKRPGSDRKMQKASQAQLQAWSNDFAWNKLLSKAKEWKETRPATPQELKALEEVLKG